MCTGEWDRVRVWGDGEVGLVGLFLFLFLLKYMDYGDPRRGVPGRSVRVVPLPGGCRLGPKDFYVGNRAAVKVSASSATVMTLTRCFGRGADSTAKFSLPVNSSKAVLFRLNSCGRLKRRKCRLSMSSKGLILDTCERRNVFGNVRSILRLLPPRVGSGAIRPRGA